MSFAVRISFKDETSFAVRLSCKDETSFAVRLSFKDETSFAVRLSFKDETSFAVRLSFKDKTSFAVRLSYERDPTPLERGARGSKIFNLERPHRISPNLHRSSSWVWGGIEVTKQHEK
jgi:hypothetical protein